MDFRPINDFVLVHPDPVSSVSEGGIVFVEKGDTKPTRGTVMRVSANVPTIKEGDKILYVQGAGEKIKLGEMTYTILDKEKIVGII
jgi:co-chaperonin GroES (HSP10)